jgi:hypothetical protein
MEISDYMLWKAIGLCALVFIWGVYCGMTGRELTGRKADRGQHDQQPPEGQD